MTTRVIAVEPMRRGFNHNFQVTLINVDRARHGQVDTVFVDVAEIYNYHRFQAACLKQLGRLCRFALEKEARTTHQLQMLWNDHLGAAAWGEYEAEDLPLDLAAERLETSAARHDRRTRAARDSDAS